jgi:hypothetical protein
MRREEVNEEADNDSPDSLICAGGSRSRIKSYCDGISYGFKRR